MKNDFITELIMGTDPAFLFYPGDYLRDTQCLSEKTQVAYDRIMCEHMRNICITQQQLKFFTKRLSEEELDELKMLLVKTKEGYQIKWVAESIEKRRTYSESRRKNREKHTNNISETYVEHMENEIENEIEREFIVEKANEKPQNFIEILLQIFKDKYQKNKNIVYIESKQDTRQLGILLGKMKKQFPEYNTEEMQKLFEVLFDKCTSIADDNFLNQITISFLNSQLNKYLNYIKNGKKLNMSKGYGFQGTDFDKYKRLWEEIN